jgi:NAD+ kinase
VTNRMNAYVYSKHDKDSRSKKSMVEDSLTHEGFTMTEDLNTANNIISIGGDGSFLQAVRKTGFRQDCLYAGISTSGKHSLYCDFHYNNLYEMTQAIRDSKLEVRRYPLIEVTIDEHRQFYCLNEFSIRSNIIRTFVLDVIIDDKLFETFLGDGLIISTPTGSTAYNKSVNGAVVDPLLNCFQVTELASVNNNKYRTLGSPFILSGERKLNLHVHQDGNDFPLMAADNEALGVRKVENLKIELSDKTIKTVKLKDNSFWEKVQRIHL